MIFATGPTGPAAACGMPWEQDSSAAEASADARRRAIADNIRRTRREVYGPFPLPPSPPPPWAGTTTVNDAFGQWWRCEKLPKVPTGFGWLDRPTEGGLPIGVTALVAPPGVGKSALALQWVLGALVTDRTMRATWALGEMTLGGLGRRMVCLAGSIIEGCEPVTMTEAGDRTERSGRAATIASKVIDGRLHIVEPPLSIDAIGNYAKRTGSRIVVVDYLQLLHGNDDGGDRTADLDRIVGLIRDMAIRLKCAVVPISTMAKATAVGANAAQAGRGTVEIGHAAELMYVGERDERGGRPIRGSDGKVRIVWRCAKARNFEPRDLELRFDGATQTYTADCVPIEGAG